MPELEKAWIDAITNNDVIEPEPNPIGNLRAYWDGNKIKVT